MPNPENLRKQAKRFLRWHRDGYHPVAAQIRTHLPRFHGLSDRDVLHAEFRLSDAQELVARKHGFADWPALICGADEMTIATPSTTNTAAMLSAEPMIFVSDIEAAFRFYLGLLGF